MVERSEILGGLLTLHGVVATVVGTFTIAVAVMFGGFVFLEIYFEIIFSKISIISLSQSKDS